MYVFMELNVFSSHLIQKYCLLAVNQLVGVGSRMYCKFTSDGKWRLHPVNLVRRCSGQKIKAFKAEKWQLIIELSSLCVWTCACIYSFSYVTADVVPWDPSLLVCRWWLSSLAPRADFHDPSPSKLPIDVCSRWPRPQGSQVRSTPVWRLEHQAYRQAIAGSQGQDHALSECFCLSPSARSQG